MFIFKNHYRSLKVSQQSSKHNRYVLETSNKPKAFILAVFDCKSGQIDRKSMTAETAIPTQFDRG